MSEHVDNLYNYFLAYAAMLYEFRTKGTRQRYDMASDLHTRILQYVEGSQSTVTGNDVRQAGSLAYTYISSQGSTYKPEAQEISDFAARLASRRDQAQPVIDYVEEMEDSVPGAVTIPGGALPGGAMPATMPDGSLPPIMPAKKSFFQKIPMVTKITFGGIAILLLFLYFRKK